MILLRLLLLLLSAQTLLVEGGCGQICTSSSQCSGNCRVCFAAQCQECQADSHCVATFGQAKPFCKRITVTKRECRADTCSMACLSSSECKGRCSKCRWFKCKERSGGCFPGSGKVELNMGDTKTMDKLRIGDEIMTITNGIKLSTKVLGFLDKRVDKTTVYLVLHLEDGKSLSISPNHALFTQGEDKTLRSNLAKQVVIDDMVLVQQKGQFTAMRVIDITMQERKGAYVPLTDSGTLLVDGVLVSCYTNTNHWLAHSVLTPLRWWPELLLDDKVSEDIEGVRTIPSLVKMIGDFIGVVNTGESNKDGKLDTPWSADQIHCERSKVFGFDTLIS